MSREDSIIDVDLNRHRYLMERVMKRVQSYQMMWMHAEFAWESPYLKGRYLAAKQFYDWLADGGTIGEAQAYLDERKEYFRRESNNTHSLLLSVELNEQVARVRAREERKKELLALEERSHEQVLELNRIEMELRGSFTEEDIKRGWPQIYAPGFTMTDLDAKAIEALQRQQGAGVVEAHHLERLLKDPFVKGERETPLPPPPPVVIDDIDSDDENDEPD